MLRLLITAAALPLTATAAQAQDLAPALDPTATGQGIIASNIARQAQGGRSSDMRSASATSAKARATCARKAAIRQQYGDADPRVQQLYRLCSQAGY